MKTRLQDRFWMVLALSPSLIIAACAYANNDTDDGDGCTKDTDCKGARICEEQICVDVIASATVGSGGSGGTMTASSTSSTNMGGSGGSAGAMTASSASSANTGGPGGAGGSGGSTTTCGNSILEGGEQCDDGNQVDADGCEANCMLVCGSGTGADRATRDPITGHCYLGFANVTPTWQHAETSCEALGGYLAVIDSDSENQLARAASLSSSAPWIGFNDIANEAFSDPFGFVKVTGGLLTFNGFDPTEPNDWPPLGGEDCAHFLSDMDYRGPLHWNDAPCGGGVSFVSGFLCEVEDWKW